MFSAFYKIVGYLLKSGEEDGKCMLQNSSLPAKRLLDFIITKLKLTGKDFYVIVTDT